MSNISIPDLPSDFELRSVDLSSIELNLRGGFFGRLHRGIGRVAKVAASIL
jgi:hypothetical protein